MDAVDVFSAQWAAERPGVDTEALEVWGRLKRSAYLFERTLADAIEDCGLNMAEFEVLAALVRHGAPYEMRPTELTHSLIITPGAVTARLATLERRGLIARRADLSDRRVQLVSLTAKGLHQFEPAFDRVVLACRAVLDELAGDDDATINGALRMLMAGIDTVRNGDTAEAVTETP